MDAKQARFESLKNSEVWKLIQTAIDDGDFNVRVDTIPDEIQSVLEKLDYVVGHCSGGMFISW